MTVVNEWCDFITYLVCSSDQNVWLRLIYGIVIHLTQPT